MAELKPFDDLPVGFYHAILNSIKDPFNITDKNFRILYANKARASFHQQNQQDMIGRFCYEMFQRRSEPCADCPVKVVFETRKPFVMQRSVLLPDGSLKWGNVRNYPVLDDKGDVVYVLQIMIDITKFKTDNERHNKYVKSLETTMREITTKNVLSLSKYGGEEVENYFTKRETEVLGLIADGYTNVEIGKILAISPHTVKSHAMNIFDKLGVKDRTQAATWAARHKLI